MTTPFTPINDKSRRAMLIDLVSAANYDDVLTYEELGELFGLVDKPAVQSTVNSAKGSVEKNTKRTLEAVRNEGYRVVNASEHHRLAASHQRKGRGQLKRAMSKVNHVDMGELSQDQRSAVISARVALAAQADFERRADLKYAKKEDLEAYTQEANQRTERSESEIEKMKSRLARLERKAS